MAEKRFVATQATSDEINEKLGSTSDTNGTATTGSAMAKLNYLIANSGSIDYTTTLGEILTAAQGAKSIDYSSTLTSINSILSTLYLDGIKIDNSSDRTIQYASGSSTTTLNGVQKIIFLSNDGTDDLIVNIDGNNITIKTNEILNDADVLGKNVIINGTATAPFRIYAITALNS